MESVLSNKITVYMNNYDSKMVIRKMTIEMFTLEIVYKDVIRTGITT